MSNLLIGLVVTLIAVLAWWLYRRTFCARKSALPGYWTSPAGELFEIFGGPQNGEYSITTASGFLGASPDKAYPLRVKGCRSVSIAFPAGTIRGRVGVDRRRLIWDNSQSWYRQGV